MSRRRPDLGEIVRPKRVLIVLMGAIGDVVRALPLAQRLRRAWPDVRLAWAVEPAAEPIVRFHPAIDEVILFARGAGVSAFPPFLRRVRRFGADLTLDLQRLAKSGTTSWYSCAPVRVGFHWRNSREGNWFFNTHHIPPVERWSSKVLQYLTFGDALALPPAPVEFGLRLQPEEQTRIAELLAGVAGRFAVVWLGSTWPSRQWFPGPTAELCRGLRERGLEVVVIGAASDAAFARAVLAAGSGPVTSLVGRTTLRDVIGVLSRAALAVGPDSGPMHIAGAVGTPVVSLWGATSPRRSAPYGFESLVIQGQAPCVPCYRKHCAIGRVCMESIGVAQVLARIDRVLFGS